ncbi:hypothetical protein J4447_01315 [Candidatus Pacearchaeota archaeon]|nr:hypothetical protein [Candidatus Pacearchaeota archaeon]
MAIVRIQRYVDRNKGYQALDEGTVSVWAPSFRWHLNHGTQVGVEAAMPNLSQRFIGGLLVAEGDELLVTASVDGSGEAGMQRRRFLDMDYGYFRDGQVKDLGELLSSGREIHLFAGSNRTTYDSYGRVLVFSLKAPPEEYYERVQELRAIVMGFDAGGKRRVKKA